MSKCAYLSSKYENNFDANIDDADNLDEFSIC